MARGALSSMPMESSVACCSFASAWAARLEAARFTCCALAMLLLLAARCLLTRGMNESLRAMRSKAPISECHAVVTRAARGEKLEDGGSGLNRHAAGTMHSRVRKPRKLATAVTVSIETTASAGGWERRGMWADCGRSEPSSEHCGKMAGMEPRRPFPKQGDTCRDFGSYARALYSLDRGRGLSYLQGY